MKNKLGCIGVIVLILVMLARCSSCAQSDVDSKLHDEGIYKVEITKVQSKDGDFILKGKINQEIITNIRNMGINLHTFR